MLSQRRTSSFATSVAIKWLIVTLSFLVAAAAFFSPPAMVKPHLVVLRPDASNSTPGGGSAPQRMGFSSRARRGLVQSMEALDRHTPESRRQKDNKGASTGYAVGVTGIRG